VKRILDPSFRYRPSFDTDIRDDGLDNITLFWLTNTGVSAGRLYWENKLPFFDVKNVSIPVAVSVFPDEIDAVPRNIPMRAGLFRMPIKNFPEPLATSFRILALLNDG
jgi:hypothetical protein